MEPFSQRAYRRRVLKRAMTEASTSRGVTPKKAFWSFVAGVLVVYGLCFLGLTKSEDELLGRLVQAAIGLPAALLILAVVAAGWVLRVPAILDYDAAQTSKAEIGRIQADKNALQKQADEKPLTRGETVELIHDLGLKGRKILHNGGDGKAFIEMAKVILGDVLRKRRRDLFLQNGNDLARWDADLVNDSLRLKDDDINFECRRSQFDTHRSWVDSQ